MVGVDLADATWHAAEPHRRGSRDPITLQADFGRQLDPQPPPRHGRVLVLAAALVGFGANAGGAMDDDDGRFYLVAMLAAGTGTARRRDVTLGAEHVVVEFGGVDRHPLTSPSAAGRCLSLP